MRISNPQKESVILHASVSSASTGMRVSFWTEGARWEGCDTWRQQSTADVRRLKHSKLSCPLPRRTGRTKLRFLCNDLVVEGRAGGMLSLDPQKWRGLRTASFAYACHMPFLSNPPSVHHYLTMSTSYESSSLWNVPQPPITASFFGRNIFFSTLLFDTRRQTTLGDITYFLYLIFH